MNGVTGTDWYRMSSLSRIQDPCIPSKCVGIWLIQLLHFKINENHFFISRIYILRKKNLSATHGDGFLYWMIECNFIHKEFFIDLLYKLNFYGNKIRKRFKTNYNF